MQGLSTTWFYAVLIKTVFTYSEKPMNVNSRIKMSRQPCEKTAGKNPDRIKMSATAVDIVYQQAPNLTQEVCHSYWYCVPTGTLPDSQDPSTHCPWPANHWCRCCHRIGKCLCLLHCVVCLHTRNQSICSLLKSTVSGWRLKIVILSSVVSIISAQHIYLVCHQCRV